MNIEKFIEKNPYLYHLTSSSNAKSIIQDKTIYSANELIDMSENEDDIKIKCQKRFQHYPIKINGIEIWLRDQRPISELALGKCLTDNWQVADFLYHLNNRVFMWPTINRLERHFRRYKSESPIIFRFPTKEILELNTNAKFCRLNSGATRANSYLGGKAPERGPKTFLSAKDYDLSVSSVAEVTFEKSCIISNYYIDIDPYGPFNKKAI